MDIQNMISDLQAEKSKIELAISALEGTLKVRSYQARGSKRRHMSADARARISRAMKLRWAQRKKGK